MDFTGIIQRQWTPLLEKQKSFVDPCAVGYTDMLISFMAITDEALANNDLRTYQTLSQIHIDLFKKQIPYIQNEELRAIWSLASEGNRQNVELLKLGKMDLQSINLFLAAAVNGFNDFMSTH